MRRPIIFSMSFAAALLVSGSRADAQTLDELNGLWTVKLGGQAAGGAQTESYPEIGVRLRHKDKVLKLKRVGDTLVIDDGNNIGIIGGINGDTTVPANSEVKLEIKGLNTPDPADDQLVGKYFGKDAVFERDIKVKPPIDITMPGDRPWVRFMREILIPKSAEDRDTYHQFNKDTSTKFLMGTQLGASGYWITKGWIKDQSAFYALCNELNGLKNTPRRILNTRFSPAVQKYMRPDKKGEAALALSSLGMYFSTASGGSVRIHITSNDDSIVYYITDRRANSRTGLVINKTPLHKPLASSFGKWQNDAGDMTLADDEPYMRGVIESMTKSTTASMNQVSPTGRSAFTDYFGIMAIEDQRGVMFNNDSLDWGRNMTQASFDIGIIRALSHGQTRQKPKYDKATKKIVLSQEKELAMQVVIDGQLRPGTPSYIDVLNGADNALEGGHRGGNDCQVYGMSEMEEHTTAWLRKDHAAEINRLEKALQPFAYTPGNSNMFEGMTITFFDNANFSKVTQAQASEITEAAMAVFRVIKSDSRKLEAHMLANGVTKGSEWAPRASGF